MKKVLLHTIHLSTSIGASLQACALGYKLRLMGYLPELLYYTPIYFSNIYRTRQKPNNMRELLSFIINYKNIDLTRNRFKAFKERYHINSYGQFKSVEELMKANWDYFAYICGSDQIWNPWLTRYDMSYFLSFVKNTAPRVSYAASIGCDSLTPDFEKFLQEGLSYITHIGVREDTSVDIIKRLCPDRTVTQNIDPTFLLDKNTWLTMEFPIDANLPSKYILYYPMGKITAEGTNILLELKKRYSLPCVSFSSSYRKPIGVDINLRGLVGPGEFLHLCNNAEYIVTNSFHGMALSLIFKKKLVCYKKAGQNVRLASLARLLNAEDLLINDVSQFATRNWDKIWDACYTRIDTIIAHEQRRSEKYLHQAIENE